MSPEAYVAIGVGSVTVLAVAAFIFKKIPKRLKREKFVDKWKQLQQRCADKEQWPLAIIEADTLLDNALKKKKYKGKSMGERLVSAQKNFTNNDGVWFGHKLRTKIEANPDFPLTQDDVKKALLGIQQGLKDIGAL